MAEDEIFEPIIEPRIISLELEDHRLTNRHLSGTAPRDFQVKSVGNTVEWIIGTWLSEAQVEEILEDKKRLVEVVLH